MEKAWVCKFGGTSLANASQIKKVKEIIEGDKRRRFVVVSAPGKEDSKDTKITDLLLECHSLVKRGESFDHPFAKIRERFLKIGEALGTKANLTEELDTIYRELPHHTTSDYAASRGEYLNALLLSEYF
ncbi:MAG: aspartate kinase, partial [Sphaerochaetaceae bacterium]